MNDSFGFSNIVNSMTNFDQNYLPSEEQDALISQTIQLISQKFLELLTAVHEHSKEYLSVDAKLPSLYTLVTKKWKEEFLNLYDKLKSWELANVGQLQFTLCFTKIAEFFDPLNLIMPTTTEEAHSKTDLPATRIQ